VKSGQGKRTSATEMPQPLNGSASENTGLLSGQENGGTSGESADSFFRSIFNTQQTAGMESDNKFVRIPAQVLHVTKVTLYSNYVNILLVFVPLGIVAGATGWNPTTVFVLNFFAIVPLAAVLSFATEEIAVKLGQTMGGLLNATFGNAVELIVCVAFPGRCALLSQCAGQYHCVAKWRNQNCAIEYARKYPLQYSSSTWMLLLSRWHSQY